MTARSFVDWNLATLCLGLLLILSFRPASALAQATATSSSSSSRIGGIDDENLEIINSKWILSQHLKEGEEFQARTHAQFVADKPIKNLQEFCKDHIVIQVEAIGVDAFIRTLLDDSPNNVHGTIPLGSTIPAIGYGRIISVPNTGNKNIPFQKGDRVLGMMGAQCIATIPQTQIQTLQLVERSRPSLWKRLSRKLRGRSNNDARECLNALGISGLTAYVGMHNVLGPPKKGQTAVVSAAAGSVGCLAAQLAKLIPGVRVVGIAGGPTKTEWLLQELQLDAVVDYKHPTKSIETQLQEACPNGIDFYFDNVGGPLLDVILKRLNRRGRIVICGAISQYSQINHGEIYGPSNYIKLAETSSQMAGFVLTHYPRRVLGKARLQMQSLVSRNKVKSHQTISNGIDSFGNALEQLYQGGNIGKTIVDVSGDLQEMQRSNQGE